MHVCVRAGVGGSRMEVISECYTTCNCANSVAHPLPNRASHRMYHVHCSDNTIIQPNSTCTTYTVVTRPTDIHTQPNSSRHMYMYHHHRSYSATCTVTMVYSNQDQTAAITLPLVVQVTSS